MKKFTAIAVAASMFALAACNDTDKAKRHAVQVKGWDNRWYTLAIFENRSAAETDVANRKQHGMFDVEWRIEPLDD